MRDKISPAVADHFDAAPDNALQSTTTHADSKLKRICYYTLIGRHSSLMEGPSDTASTSTHDSWDDKRRELIVMNLSWALEPYPLRTRQLILQEVCHCKADSPNSGIYSDEHRAGWRYVTEQCDDLPPELLSKPAVVFLWICFEAYENWDDEDDDPDRKADLNSILLTSRLDRLGRRWQWPCSVDDMLPCGPKDTMESFLGWLRVPDLPHMLRVRLLTGLSYVMRWAHPIVMPFALRSQDLLHVIIKHTELTTAAWAKVYNIPTRSGLIDWKSQENPFEYLYPLSLILDSLLIFSMRENLHSFLRIDEKAMLICCVQGFDVASQLVGQIKMRAPYSIANAENSSGQECEHCAVIFSRMGGELLDMSPHLQREIRLIPSLINAFHDARMTPSIYSAPLQLYNLLSRSLCALMYDQKCRRIGCRSTSADINRQLHYCAGCHRFQYCSRRCQKLAWAAEHAPHRSACAQLGAVCKIFVMPRRADIHLTQIKPLAKVSSPLMAEQAGLLRYVVAHLDAWAILDHATYPLSSCSDNLEGDIISLVKQPSDATKTFSMMIG